MKNWIILMGLLGLFQVSIAQNFIERVESVEIFPNNKNKIVV
jgi:hypothetical protein